MASKRRMDAMSLRYQALITVLVLISLVTSLLGAYVSGVYEDTERRRIREQVLPGEWKDVSREVQERGTHECDGLKSNVVSTGLLNQTGGSRAIKQGLETFARDWRHERSADVAVAALDPFVAEDRQANVLHKGEHLSLCALDTCERIDEPRKKALLACPNLNGLLGECFAANQPRWRVIQSAGSVFLVSATPFYETNQEQATAEPLGVAAVATELSNDWVKANTRENAVQKVVFAGDVVAGQSLGDADEARRLVEHFQRTHDATFEFVRQGAAGPERYLAHVDSFPNSSGTDPAGLVSIKNLDAEVREPIAKMRRKVLWGGIVLGALGAALAYAVVYVVIRKIARLQGATQRVRGGDFDTRVEVKGRDELASLGHAFNDMVTGLKALGVYTDPSLARGMLDKTELLTGQSTRVEGTILFTDIRDFTAIAEALPAESLTAQLNEYFEAVARHVKEEGGYIDKFIGDSVMAFFGPPFIKDANFAARACRAALAAAEAAAALRSRCARDGKPLFHQRMGIATGEIVLGNIGSSTKKNFTVIGDSVNVASRLEGMNKAYGTEILIDERTQELVRGELLAREIDQVSVRGKQKAVRIYELLGPVQSAAAAALER
jgi:class 3 adenylate cyclase/HAMP domain-containing protein